MKKIYVILFVLTAFNAALKAQFKMDATGKIAVGDATATPVYLLDLINGDINTAATKGYRINGEYILRNNNHTENIFVGVGAGNTTMTGHYHTFVGKLAGTANTTGQYNSFIGYGSGGANTTGSYNTAVGHAAMNVNTTGAINTVVGYAAGLNNTGSRNTFLGGLSGYSNTSGGYNTMLGAYAGYTNTTGNNNTFLGYYAGYANTSGNYNTFLGYYSGRGNTTGSYNTCLGYYAGQNNTTGTNNTCVGYYSGQANTTGGYNTCVGYYAGQSNTTGTNNTFIGYNANANSNNYNNSTAIGNGALVTASNTIYLGNSSITAIQGQVMFTQSDGRFKTNILENVKGLEFINRLRPVTYQMNTQQLDEFIIQNMPDSIKTLHQQTLDFVPSSNMVHSGFIAQEVDSVASLCGFQSSIVHTPENSTDPYGLAYSEMVVPLVKAVQELSQAVDSLKFLSKAQQNKLDQLQNDLAACCNKPVNDTKMGENNNGGIETNGHIVSVDLAKAEQIILYQNEPNPFNGATVIRYYIPENMQPDTFMAFYDAYGNEIKKVKINETGAGKIEVNAQNVAAGIYTYSLMVNGKMVDTKKMIKK